MFVALAPLTVNGVVTQVSPVGVPASAVGESVTDRAFVSTATTQLPLPVTVMVKITTVPPSAATGVYVGVSVVAPDVIDPAPFSVHKIPALLVALAPLTVNGVVSQTSAVGAPASAVGAGVMVNDFVSTASTQL